MLIADEVGPEHPAYSPRCYRCLFLRKWNPAMAETATRFQCPNCQAQYKVVRVEASPTDDQPLVCLSCGGPLHNREGKFALKYFRTDGSRSKRLNDRKPKLR
jgi:predicted RNA-binding Zn-ribbon protein involved in translation (DUF1610 family)